MVTDNESCHWILASIFMTAAVAIMLTQRYVPDRKASSAKISQNTTHIRPTPLSTYAFTKKNQSTAKCLLQNYTHVSLPKKIPHNMIIFTMIACVVPGSTMKSEMF
jgi:hypothetical protein